MKRKIFVFITVIILIILFFVVFFQLTTANKIKIDVIIAPKDAKLFIDNKRVFLKSFVYLKPNQEYKIKLERNNFNKFETSAIFTKEKNTLIYGLSAANKTGEEISKQKLNDFLEVEKNSYIDSKKDIDALIKKHPIVKNLPYFNKSMIIEYDFDKNSFDPDAKLSINIYSDKLFRNQALLILKNNEPDLSRYKIIFFDIKTRQPINPFKEYLEKKL